MIGMTVLVYTSDDQVFLYRIYRGPPGLPGRRNSLGDLTVKDGELWLQTSEGPERTARPSCRSWPALVTSHAVAHADAHPKAHPVVCG